MIIKLLWIVALESSVVYFCGLVPHIICVIHVHILKKSRRRLGRKRLSRSTQTSLSCNGIVRCLTWSIVPVIFSHFSYRERKRLLPRVILRLSEQNCSLDLTVSVQ